MYIIIDYGGSIKILMGKLFISNLIKIKILLNSANYLMHYKCNNDILNIPIKTAE